MDGWIEARKVCYAYPGPGGREVPVLRSVNAAFAKGSAVLVTGAMGAGKSTLLHILAGILRPTEGEVLMEGKAVSRWTAAHRDRWRRNVGIVFQTTHLWPELTPLENVFLPLVPRGVSLNDLRSQGQESLEAFAVLHLAGRKVRDLSGGEKQRLALARAWVARPPLLLVDEPTSHQDDEGVKILLEKIGADVRRGATVIVASHDPRIESGPFRERWRLAGGNLEQGS
jgi:ABC-type lipoprotein export system ATPase subunit